MLILGNKIDKIGAAGEHEIRDYFRLHGKTTGQVCSGFRFFQKRIISNDVILKQ